MTALAHAHESPMKTRPEKPLKAKAYGSIGHLPNSRLGPGDWHIHEGQARICLEKPRKGDRIIVTEKLDGACMAVAKIDGAIVPLTRAGYRAEDASYEHLRLFAVYVSDRADAFDGLLADGERVCGEWLALAHGTTYHTAHPLFSPFIPFDIFRDGKRILSDERVDRLGARGFVQPFCVHNDVVACPEESALDRLGLYGRHGATEPIEGAVWRVEREGRVDFLAKLVRADKQDGKYLSDITGHEPVWHWLPSRKEKGGQ